MKIPTREAIESLRKNYVNGSRVKLLKMEDNVNPVAPGSLGTVIHVDDIGQIHVKWDNGRGLALIPGVDRFIKS